ncbi:MAG: hypothetical protein KGN84_15160 [Acidobacteriota bacterium]|nr:hypothetical protein [Acidobacteriota bacterium]
MFQEKPLSPAFAWRNSDTVCALADGERHLGHILKIGGRWHAFDATHANKTDNGFRFLGTYASLVSAKQAVEQSRESAELHSFLFGAA